MKISINLDFCVRSLFSHVENFFHVENYQVSTVGTPYCFSLFSIDENFFNVYHRIPPKILGPTMHFDAEYI